jgi:hypothetical protein
MSCLDEHTCHDTLESLYEDLKNRKNNNDYFKDPILTIIVEKFFTLDEWKEEDIPLLRSIKNGGPVIDQDFKTQDTSLADYFRKIVGNMDKPNIAKVFKSKIAYLVTVYGGSKNRRFKKRQRKSKKRQRSRLM